MTNKPDDGHSPGALPQPIRNLGYLGTALNPRQAIALNSSA
jgi:hypothetical protein